jgi:hypothetical protein
LEAEAHGDATRAVAAFQDAARLDAAFAAARTQLAAGPSETSRGRTSVQHVLDLSAQAINTPVTTKLPEAADAPLSAGQLVTLILGIRVFP